MVRVISCSLLLFFAGRAAAQVSLSWKLPVGSSFTLERVYQQKQSIEAKGKTLNQDTDSTWTTRMLVKKHADGDIVLEQTILSVSFKHTPAAAADNALTADLAEKMKGTILQVTISPAGRVRKLEGYDDLIKKMADGKRELEKSLRFLIPETALRDGLEETIGFLPEKAVQPKDHWQRQAVDPVPPFGSLKTIFDYTYIGPKDGADEITYTTQTTYVPAAKDLGLIRVVKGTLESEDGKGKVLFDRAKGMLIRGEKQVRLKGKLTLETPGNTTSDLEFTSDNRVQWRILAEKK